MIISLLINTGADPGFLKGGWLIPICHETISVLPTGKTVGLCFTVIIKFRLDSLIKMIDEQAAFIKSTAKCTDQILSLVWVCGLL